MDINTLPELEIVSDEEPSTQQDNTNNDKPSLDKNKPSSPSKTALNKIDTYGDKGSDVMEEESLMIEEKEGESNPTPQSENYRKKKL